MTRLSVNTAPFVRTFAILAIKPKAGNKTERLDANSKEYRIAVSSFSMDGNCFMIHALSVKTGKSTSGSPIS
jgi:hypothetical protein